MKKFILKIRNKRLKGNISLLIIFILLATSVIALLSINQIQRLLTYWNMTFNYFRAFYLAKAGTELWLTEVYNREAWFQHTIDSWDAIVMDNLVWEYAGFNPYFTMNIESSFSHLTDDVRYTKKCDDDNRIVLAPNEWIILPLFKDNKKSNILNPELSNIDGLSDSEIESIYFENLGWEFNMMYWIFAYNEIWKDMVDIIVKKWDNNLNKFLRENISKIKSNYKYLSIKNQWTNEVKFCIAWNDKIPYSKFLITVSANFWDMEVWLQSIVKKEVPFWALDVLWW